MSKPAATDYGCPECFADRVLADRGDKVGICAECGWFGPLQDESATPSSPETPSELSTLLEDVRSARKDMTLTPMEEASDLVARLLAIYNRQREEIERQEKVLASAGGEIYDLLKSVERLKAEQPKFTQEDATRVRDWAMCWSHRPFYDLADRIESALRLRSLSGGTTDV